MMEEVPHHEEGATHVPEVVMSNVPSSPLQPQLTPPPQASYSSVPTVMSGHGGSPQLPQTSFTPVSGYPPSTLTAASSSATQYTPTSSPHGAPVSQSSTVVVSDMPEYSMPEQKTDSDSGSGVWGWFKSASQNTFVQTVVEKTKTGVDRMITTLDPGMTPYLRQGGDVVVIVASEKEVKWGAVRDAFQKVFGMAQVTGLPAQPSVAPQPVGFAAGLRGAQDRISYLRRSGLVNEKQLCVAVESFVAELLPDKWFDIGCLVLDDPALNVNLEVFTQAVPVPAEVINHIQSATPADYNLSWSGLSVTVGQAFQYHMPWIEPSDWHKTLTGHSRRSLIYSAALTLAGLYKEKFPKSIPGKPI